MAEIPNLPQVAKDAAAGFAATVDGLGPRREAGREASPQPDMAALLAGSGVNLAALQSIRYTGADTQVAALTNEDMTRNPSGPGIRT